MDVGAEEQPKIEPTQPNRELKNEWIIGKKSFAAVSFTRLNCFSPLGSGIQTHRRRKREEAATKNKINATY